MIHHLILFLVILADNGNEGACPQNCISASSLANRFAFSECFNERKAIALNQLKTDGIQINIFSSVISII